MRSWRGTGLALVALAVAAVCVRLGVWQLDRLRERRTRNAAIVARREAPPLDIVGRVPADSVWQRVVRVTGVLDYTAERVWPGRTVEGVPGVAILTPLRLADGTAVFVDRGWVPSPDARRVDLGRARERDTVTVGGLGLRAPRAAGDVDPAALADSLPYPIAPFVVQWLPAASAYADSPLPVRRWPAPVLDDGPHLFYAIQWLAFAAIALGGMVAVVREGRRGRAPEEGRGLTL